MPKPKAKPAAPRKRTGRTSRNKGTRGEVEFVEFLLHYGIPAQRVLASGSFLGAKSDIKVGVALNPNGTMPSRDEGVCILRAEVKNRKDNPKHLYPDMEYVQAILIEASRHGSETVWGHLNQDEISKALVLRRDKVPDGAIKNMDGNQVFMVCMGLEDWAELFLKAYPDAKIPS